ncbi:hypothetical protein GCM10023186_10510 [Hymenobacter koreensis]|uniref:Phosphatidic acid phosphatase type 2/haloperoxidase domain-containing protein n=2 Tax=Hymenobacter koreensis TaxID=1084523 RepID=A0ABP8IWH2_9BACT
MTGSLVGQAQEVTAPVSLPGVDLLPSLRDTLPPGQPVKDLVAARPLWWRQLVLPAGLVGAGALLRKDLYIEDIELLEIGELELEIEDLKLGPDKGIRTRARRHFAGLRTTLDDHLRYVPGFATLGLSVLGVEGRHKTIDQALLLGMIHVLNGESTHHLKRLTAVSRPHGRSFDSFPSAHASAAFARAHFMHKEYGHRSGWYTAAGYSMAVATGALRIAKDNHWFSDVLAGAGVGILSTELVYLAYPGIKRTTQRAWQRLRPGRPDLSSQALVLPFYAQGAAGATLIVHLPGR